MDTATTKIASATEPQSRAGASPDFRASSSNSDRLPLARTDSGGLLSPTSESSRSRPSSQGSLSRNQAPGILDRRRSVRPSSTNRGSLCVGDADKSRKRRSVGPILPVKISNMADFQNELKVDGGSRPVTPGDTEVRLNRMRRIPVGRCYTDTSWSRTLSKMRQNPHRSPLRPNRTPRQMVEQRRESKEHKSRDRATGQMIK